METTALGVAFLAGLYSKVWLDINEISKIWQKDIEYLPLMDEETKSKYIKKWSKAVKMCMGWEKTNN